jgi:hypothetical protein
MALNFIRNLPSIPSSPDAIHQSRDSSLIFSGVKLLVRHRHSSLDVFACENHQVAAFERILAI